METVASNLESSKYTDEMTKTQKGTKHLPVHRWTRQSRTASLSEDRLDYSSSQVHSQPRRLWVLNKP